MPIPIVTDPEIAAREIQALLPAFAVETIAHLGEGLDCTAFLVNATLVFRFPRRAEVSVQLAREAALLPRLAARLSVRVPEIAYVGWRGGDVTFLAHQFLAGTPLGNDRLDVPENCLDADVEEPASDPKAGQTLRRIRAVLSATAGG